MLLTNERRFPISLSILAAVMTLGIKFAAYWLTDSVSLLSDAAESVVNLLAALVAFGCLWYSSLPVDSSHTYGHEKIEFFSSGLEGALILIAAAGIGWYAIQRLILHHSLQPLTVGVLLSSGAAIINLVVASILIRVGRRTNSIILEANGQHLMTDVWTSAGVLVGLGLVHVTGWEILDPILALAVAANIVWTGVDLIRRSFNGLMDHSLPADEQQLVRTAIESLMKPGLHYHAVRTRQAGARRFVDFHLLVPGKWTVKQAHDFTENVEAAVRAALPGAEVTVHIEPIEEEVAWKDSELLAVEARASQE
ncbi:MAG: cation transporter [Gemmataceae bacterium]|nr:cation transporter [Gemmataceae bacterium]